MSWRPRYEVGARNCSPSGSSGDSAIANSRSLIAEPGPPESRLRDEIVRVHRVSRIGHEIGEIDARLDALEESRRHRREPRMLRIAVFEHVEKIGAIVNAGAEQIHIRRGGRAVDELAHRRRGQVGLEAKSRRQKSVKSLLVQRLAQQKFADRPVFEPVGPLVRRVVQNLEAGIQFRSRRVVIQNLIDMHRMHAGKHTGFFTRQRDGSAAPDISSGSHASSNAAPRDRGRWRRAARAAPPRRSAAPGFAPSLRGCARESR